MINSEDDFSENVKDFLKHKKKNYNIYENVLLYKALLSDIDNCDKNKKELLTKLHLFKSNVKCFIEIQKKTLSPFKRLVFEIKNINLYK